MQKVHIRLTCTIERLPLGQHDTFQHDIGGPHEIQAVLRAPTSEEQSLGHDPSRALCVVSSTWPTKDQIEAVFLSIESDTIASELELSAPFGQYRGPDGLTLTRPGLHQLPPRFQSFSQTVFEELRAVATQLADLARWRLDNNGHPWPVRGVDTSWSRDREFWHPYPPALEVSVLAPEICLGLTANMRDTLRALLDANEQAPAHHELFREASILRYTSPRSALVMGVAAAEVALKHCIGRLAPQTEWLVRNLQSPPIDKLAREQLPLLDAPNRFGDKVLPPPEWIVAALKEATSRRNGIVHLGNDQPVLAHLEELLAAIRDTIWLCDYYCGKAWALEYMSADTRNALQQEGARQSSLRASR